MNPGHSLQPTPPLIHARAFPLAGALLETYAYAPGRVEPLPRHTHLPFQFGLSLDCDGEYRYRGALHRIPPAAISLIQSGEAHSPSERRSLPRPATFRMLYVEPHVIADVAAELQLPASDALFFPAVTTTDPLLVAAFLHLHASIAAASSQLAIDEHVLGFLARLISVHSRSQTRSPRWLADRAALDRVRDFLADQPATNVTLRDLAHLAGLSRFHLCRVFQRRFGVSPHAYHVHVRIDRAKTLLAAGIPIREVARATGFADQSHFGRHFRRLVGTSPGRYRQLRNNVPDS